MRVPSVSHFRYTFMSYSKKVVKNTVANWANLLISLVISFFLAPFVLHKIGNVHYGIWALVTQVTGYLWLLDFGVRDSVVKYVAEYHAKENRDMLAQIISASLKMYSLLCLGCVVFSGVFAFFLPHIFHIAQDAVPTAQVVMIIAGLDIAQAFVFNVFVGTLMGIQRYDVFSKISIMASLIRTTLFVVFLSHGHGLVAIILIQFLTNSCSNLIIFYVSRRLLPVKLDFRTSYRGKGTYRMILNYGFFVFLNIIGMQAIFYSTSFIIAIFLPISSVTFYVIAANLVDYMKKIILSGTQVLGPLTSELDAKDEFSKISAVLIHGTKYSLLFGLPIAVVYFFLGSEFIGLWMGLEYATVSGNILAVLAAMTLFSLPHYTVQGILLGLNKHQVLAYIRIIEAIANISLSIILIKHYGIMGAVLGIAVSHLIVVVFVLPAIGAKTVKIKLWNYIGSSYKGPLISTVPFALACYFVRFVYTPHSLLAFFAEVTILLPIYCIGIWIITLTEKERMFCRNKFLSIIPVSTT
jgi:O-antigen/teichoic acid export membrane protein